MSKQTQKSELRLRSIAKFAFFAAAVAIAILGARIEVYWLCYMGAVMALGAVVVIFATTKSKPVGLDVNLHAHRHSPGVYDQLGSSDGGGDGGD